MFHGKHINIVIVATTFTVFLNKLSELSLNLYWLYIILYVSKQKSQSTRHVIGLLILCVCSVLVSYFVNLENDTFLIVDPLKISNFGILHVLWKDISLRITLHHCINVRIFKHVALLRFFRVLLICCLVYLYCYCFDIIEAFQHKGVFNARYNVIISNGNFSQSQWGDRINVNDNDVTATQRLFREQEGYMYLYSSKTTHGNNGSSVSMENLKIERFVGEGIRLPCTFSYKIPRSERLLMSISEIRTTKGFSIFPFFTKDNEDIGNSSKQSFHISLEEDNDLINYKIDLDIYALETVDFGLYRGGLKFVFVSDCRCIHKRLQITELYMCAFNITQVSEYYYYVDAPVGSLLTFKDLFLRGVPNEDSLHIEHFINGISFNESDTSVKCCLKSASLFKDGRDLTIIKESSLSFELSDIYEISGEICVCSSIYGIHRFKLYRYNFDHKYNLRKTLEFWHPHVTVVYPKSSNLIWNTISEKESILIDKSKKDKNFSLFSGETFQYLQIKMDLEHSIMQYFETCLYIGTVCALIVSILYSWGYSMAFGDWIHRFISEKLGITVNLRLPDAGGNLANFGDRRYAIATYRYTFEFDVFLSYVEEDKRFVEDELIPLLQEQNQRVCFNDENLPSGPLIPNLEQAVINSKKVIVVVSNSYTSNHMYNTFLLPTIILPMLYDGNIPSKHLMLLVCRHCMIPMPLLTDNRIVVLDYTRNPIHICQRQLHDWLHSS